MIARPDNVDAWTLGLIQEVAASGMCENDWYDLKSDLQGKAEKQRKIVAAFANTDGGYLVYGVKNDRTVAGVTNTELPRDFGNKLAHGLNPSVDFVFGTPIPVDDGQHLWICHVPRSKRGPHGVLVNEAWVFPKRTPSGSNISMTVEEIRSAFSDSSRKRQNLLWLRAEVLRIRDLGERLNVCAHSTDGLAEPVLERFDVGQLRTAMVAIFEDLAPDPQLVNDLQGLIEHCQMADTALAPMTTFALLPRDRSYSGSRHTPESVLSGITPQIVMTADRALQRLPLEAA